MADLFDGVVPFVHAARARSFRAAAEALGVTPAAVSKAVKKLEAGLGVELLHRTTRRVSLSDEGAQFLARCEHAIAAVEAGRDEVSRAQVETRGRLRVSLSHVLGRHVLQRLPLFTARYPAVDVELRFSDRLSRLVDEHVDVALRVGPLSDSSLVARRILSTRWVTVASPAYLGRHERPGHPDDIAGHACIRFRNPRGKPSPWWFRGPGGKPFATEVAGRLDLDQGEHILTAAEAGLGLAQVFDFMAAESLAAGRLVTVLDGHAAAGPDVFAVTLAGRRSAPRVRAFLDFAAAQIGTPSSRVS